MDPAPPTELGRYRITGELRANSLGRALLGVDESGRRAEVTVVHPVLAADPGFRDRFCEEVRAAAGAPPWFAAPVLDFDPDADPPWLATAHVEGPSLQDYVAEHGPLGEAGVLALGVRLADGLTALHASGHVHRDLTPSTVVLADDGPRLVGVGVVRAADDVALAQVGHLAGTPAWMSPEQAVGRRDTGAAGDVFAFGALLAFAAGGRSPFAVDGPPSAVLQRVVAGEPDLGGLTGPLRDLVASCLAKDPAARPGAAELRTRLRVLEEGREEAGDDAAATARVPVVPGAPGPAPAPTAAPRVSAARTASSVPPRTWVVLGAVAAAVVGVVVVVALVVGGGGGGTVAAPPVPPSGGPPPSEPVPDGVIDATTDDRFGAGGPAFASPSGNIACSITAVGARCDVAEQSWDLPPKPEDCTAAWGTGVVLELGRPAELSCVGDTLADPDLEVLAYGEAVRFAGVTCTSRETGVRCEEAGSAHGFEVARAAYRVF
jgi:eukaryotic-like serine/threonine-protein kinase